jgi:hypothetical protein
MKHKVSHLGLTLGIALALAACGAGWAQETVVPGPPLPPLPPPDGQFFFLHSEPLFGGLDTTKVAPFSAQAVTETTQVLGDGNQINHNETSQLYRDSAGRTRRESTLTVVGPWAAAKTPRQIVNISDPVTGVNYMLDVNDKTAVKLPFHAGHGQMREGRMMMMMGTTGGGDVMYQKSIQVPDGPVTAGAASAGVSAAAEPGDQSGIERTKESLGTQQMAGVRVEGTRTTETIPAGLIGNKEPIVTIDERWYSPDLHVTVYSKRIDPRFGTTVYQLTGITRAEPDASLFQVPPDYIVKDKPGMLLREKPAE